MKCQFKMAITAFMVIGALSLSVTGFSQAKKLPDGTVVNSDGTKKLPNGTVIDKDGASAGKRKTITLPDGRVVSRDRAERYPNERRLGRRNNGKWLPPGQAKKIYGGRAKDYAPGQQKKLKKNRKEWRGENGHKGKHNNHDKNGKGHQS